PYSVVLLDEIEKAHPEVFNVLLQLLDDGRLTDGHGRTVDFRNTVVIMTSNLGSGEFDDLSIGANERAKDRMLAKVREHFRPEFINRIDDIVVFHPLSAELIKRIVDIQLERLSDRLRERRIEIYLTDCAREQLAIEGYDPTYGARPLKRAIQREILNPLAKHILEGKIKDGDRVLVDHRDGAFTFETAAEGAPSVESRSLGSAPSVEGSI
ncbi:MAG: hypothetical protein C4342_07475, partial [Armatimonadota bacterium]